MRAELGFVGVRVTKKDGSFVCYPPSADTDTARFTAWTTAHTALLTGETIECPPGNYYITTNFINLKAATYIFNGARFYTNASTAAGGGGAYANWTFWASALSNLVIRGPLIIDGGSVNGKFGLVVQNCYNHEIYNVLVKNFTGSTGYGFWPAGDGATKTPSKHWTNCQATGCGTGWLIQAGAEYNTFTSCHAESNTVAGFDIGGGNNYFLGCQSTLNATNIILRNGGNAGHGSWVGGSANHATTKGLLVKSTFPLGFQFAATHFFANGTGGLDLGGAGVNFDACEIDCNVTCSETQEGLHTFRGCLMPASNTVISTLTAPQRANIKFYDCNTLTGKWAYNDPTPAPIYTVATLPAVAASTYGTCAVTDSLGPAVGVAVSAGGSAKCLVTSNGTNWVVSAVL